ncbi:hypothetical protein N7481_007963 [Penicillium waksmanii]|uniref:uncharacterized protein n=1 Tax=Penicillium waksmanii TaxID=69791 RepID=UPI002548119F|nr:uncharacterized protein N7481_007963 [Penicillium waksmanii]KAJ5980665.1 hypothetical protein N7481_007963 [Penicillium waksmanii]
MPPSHTRGQGHSSVPSPRPAVRRPPQVTAPGLKKVRTTDLDTGRPSQSTTGRTRGEASRAERSRWP